MGCTSLYHSQRMNLLDSFPILKNLIQEETATLATQCNQCRWQQLINFGSTCFLGGTEVVTRRWM